MMRQPARAPSCGLFELGWVGHAPAASRAVRLTGEGRAGLAATFGVRLDDDAVT